MDGPPRVHILLIHTDLYFTFCTRREICESQVPPTQPPGTDNYQLFCVMKRESELDSFKWLPPWTLFLYLC